jgi:hypothetical protein
VRSALNWSDQRLEGTERRYLLAEVPGLIVGGGRNSVIPVEHTVAAHDLPPSSGLQIFVGAGHFPHAEQSARFAELLTHFLTDTRAAQSSPSRDHWACSCLGCQSRHTTVASSLISPLHDSVTARVICRTSSGGASS